MLCPAGHDSGSEDYCDVCGVAMPAGAPAATPAAPAAAPAAPAGTDCPNSAAANLPDGRVEVSAQGSQESIQALIELLGEETSLRSRPGHVSGITVQWHDPTDGLSGFRER